MMSKLKLIIWLPAVLGIVLLIVVKVDLYQFHNQSIEVGGMLWREMPIVILGLLSSAAMFLTSIYCLVKKQWSIAAQSFFSPLLFLICFSIAGALGGAFLNAT